jgi:hypothetical protein
MSRAIWDVPTWPARGSTDANGMPREQDGFVFRRDGSEAGGEIPKHYLTERGILFSRKELDEWLMER